MYPNICSLKIKLMPRNWVATLIVVIGKLLFVLVTVTNYMWLAM